MEISKAATPSFVLHKKTGASGEAKHRFLRRPATRTSARLVMPPAAVTAGRTEKARPLSSQNVEHQHPNIPGKTRTLGTKHIAPSASCVPSVRTSSGDASSNVERSRDDKVHCRRQEAKNARGHGGWNESTRVENDLSPASLMKKHPGWDMPVRTSTAWRAVTAAEGKPRGFFEGGSSARTITTIDDSSTRATSRL